MLDPVLARERLNQIRTCAAALDARRDFLEQSFQGVLDHPLTEGLNHKHPSSRLPVYLPGGNTPVGGFLALTSLHALLVTVLALLSLFTVITRYGPAGDTRWYAWPWWWHASAR